MRRAFHAMMMHIDTCVGRIVEELTSGVDILPTVCLLAGAEIPDQVSGKLNINREGTLFPEGTREHILAEWDNDKNSADDYVRCLRTTSEKLVYYPGKDFGEFYDLEEDPEEFYNKYSDESCREHVERMKEKLLIAYSCRRSRTKRKAEW